MTTTLGVSVKTNSLGHSFFKPLRSALFALVQYELSSCRDTITARHPQTEFLTRILKEAQELMPFPIRCLITFMQCALFPGNFAIYAIYYVGDIN